MFIEFQIAAQTFLDAALQWLQTQKIDFSQQFEIDGHTLIIDHVEFPPNRLEKGGSSQEPIYYNQDLYGIEYEDDTATQLLLVQPVVLYVADLADIEANPNNPPANLYAASTNIYFLVQYGEVYYSSQPDEPASLTDRLSVSFERIDPISHPLLPFGISPSALADQLSSVIQTHAPYLGSTLGLASHAFANPVVINTGMSFDPALTRLSFRQEMGGGTAADPSIWQDYFNGNLPDHLQGAPWGVFLDHNVIEENTKEQIDEGFQKHPNSQFQLVSGISSQYSNDKGTPAVTSTFGGNVDTPLCTVWADVEVRSELRVDTPNVLTSDSHLSWDTSSGACDIAAAVLGATIGFGADLIMPWLTSLLNPITGALAGLGTLMYLEGSIQPPIPAPPKCTSVSSTELICQKTFQSISTPLGTLSMTSVMALDDGILLTGQMTTASLGTAQAEFAIEDAFHWEIPSVPCASLGPSTIQQFAANPQSGASLSATITVTAQGPAPVYLFYVVAIDDPQHLFDNAITVQGQQSPLEIDVNLHCPGASYYEAPYPCQLLIATSGGTRLVSLGPVPPLSQGAIDFMIDGLLAQEGRCKEHVTNWFDYYLKYRVPWSVDPGPDQKVFQFYEIEIQGMPAGAPVLVSESGFADIETAFAHADYPLQLTALTDPVRSKDLDLSRLDAKPQDIQPQRQSIPLHDRSFSVTQRLLMCMSQVPIPAETKNIFACNFNNRPMIFVLSTGNLIGYDIGNPYIPVLASRIPAQSWHGLLPFQGGLLGFGDQGFFPVGVNSGAQNPCCNEAPIYDAVLAAGLIYALTPRGLEVFSRTLQRIGKVNEIESPECGSMAFRSTSLLVSDRRVLRQYTLTKERGLQFLRMHPIDNVVDIVAPPFGRVNSWLLVNASGASALYLFQQDESPILLSKYPSLPWWRDTVTLNRTLARWDRNAQLLSLNCFGKSKRL